MYDDVYKTLKYILCLLLKDRIYMLSMLNIHEEI